MARTTADPMAETFIQAGVKRIFGAVSDFLNVCTDALWRMRTIDWIHMRHEAGAAFTPGAKAHLTGELAGARSAPAGLSHRQMISMSSDGVEPQMKGGGFLNAFMMRLRQQLISQPTTTVDHAEHVSIGMMKRDLDGRTDELSKLAETTLLR